MTIQLARRCGLCVGGWINGEPCEHCGGTGSVVARRPARRIDWHLVKLYGGIGLAALALVLFYLWAA